MKASILVVDDQEAIARSSQYKLKSQGYDVDTAANGEEALTRIEQKNYDIVLLDINMPLMNGIQVLEFITSKHPYTDVVMMTALDDYSMATECIEKGAKDYLLKPIDLTELVSRIKSLLRVRDSEHRFLALRNLWQSTILFDVLGSLRSIQFIMNHTLGSMKSVLSEKDRALLSHALELNDQIAHTLRESTKVNDFAVCNRSHKCADCALKDKENVKEYDRTDGFFLLRQTETDLGLLVKRIADRYESCILEKKIVFKLLNDSQLPHVQCDAERVEQVVNSIFEIGINTSKQNDLLSVTLAKSQIGLLGEPSECAICTIEYSNRSITPEELLVGMTEKETEWKNINNTLTASTLNLTISRRIIEAQGGSFQVSASENNRIQIKITLPLA
ncbi:MAG: response regulator [Ignavibacteriales bacterium]|nr:response regulator [Ignavibacteriales bacterium]